MSGFEVTSEIAHAAIYVIGGVTAKARLPRPFGAVGDGPWLAWTGCRKIFYADDGNFGAEQDLHGRILMPHLGQRLSHDGHLLQRDRAAA
jgi:hypothetical protein